MEQDMSARHGGTGRYLLKTSDGTTQELSAEELQQQGVDIICNPFLLRLWLQNPENMTLIPIKFACTFPREQSWRRMLLTSPPITSLSMTLWYTRSHSSTFVSTTHYHLPRYTKGDNSGSQLLPSTGHVPTGVTLGHFADMLAAQPNKLEYHWMQLHGYADWLRSADTAGELPEVDKEHSRDYRGVYVNPSNGIAFPGGFGKNWR
jgi:hypothetical protein